MALAIDASSPAAVYGSSPVTTASFTPPDGALLIVAFAANSGTAESPSVPTVTDNLGSHLTYTLQDWRSHADAGPTIAGQIAIWTAVVGTGAAMTVTATNHSSSNDGGLKIWVITGQDTVTPVGAHGAAGSSSASAIAQSYTAQATSGQGFLAVCDWDTKGAETAGSGCTRDATGNGNITYGFFHRTVDDDSLGASNTLNATLPGTSANLSWAWIEILPLVVNQDIVDPPPFVMSRPMGLFAPNGQLVPWFGALDAPSQPISMAVTATEGGSTFNGIALTVKVLTGASVQNGAHNKTTTITTPNLAITPNATGSRVYGALLNANSLTTWTANGSSTFLLNQVDATNSVVHGHYKSTGTTTASTPVTLGASAPTGSVGGLAQAEILGTTTEDPSSPPAVSATAAITVTTSVFSPPAGALLVAMVTSDGGTVATMTVSGGSLTWTQVDLANASGAGYAGIWIAQVPGGTPAAPAIVIQSPRRRPLPQRVRPGRGGSPVPPQVVVTQPAIVLQPGHARLKPVYAALRRTAQPVPVQVAVTPPTYPPQTVRARMRAAVPRRHPTPAVPPEQSGVVQAVRARLKLPILRRHPTVGVPAEQPGPVQPPRARVRFPRLARGRQAAPVPPQVVVPPPYPPQTLRSRVRALAARRRPVAPPVPEQAAVVAAPRGRLKPARLWRGRQAAPVPPQITVPPPAYPPQPTRSRPRMWWSFRGRQAAPVPTQATVTPPAYPPAVTRSRAKFARMPRARTAIPVPPQVTVTPPVYIPQAQRVRGRLARLLRGRTAAPVPPQVAVAPPFVPGRARMAAPVRAAMPRRPRTVTPPPPPPVPLVTRIRARFGQLLRGRSKPVVPAQVTVVPPAYPPQPTRSRQRLWAARRRPSQAFIPAHSCTVIRPSTGTTTRPGSGTTVYNTATTGRPSTGTTLRPNTGTTEDPC